MASISTSKKNGTRIVYYMDVEGSRKKLRLGKDYLKLDAKAIGRHVDAIVASKIRGDAIPRATADWLQRIDTEPTLRKRLVAQGLIGPLPTDVQAKKPERMTLAQLCADYIALRTKQKAAQRSLINYGHTRDSLVAYFAAEKPIDEITEADADDWREWMKSDPTARRLGDRTKPLAPNTYNKRCSIARGIFRRAKKKRFIAENPFAELRGLDTKPDESKDYFLSKADAIRVLSKCPNAKWKLIFALARFGGLRCPCEYRPLTVGDVDWAAGKIRIASPKTGERFIPIFPELRPFIEAVIRELGDRAVDDPTTPLIDHSATSWNFGTHMARLVRKAGLEPWPLLFQNLRKARENELLERWPERVVLRWIGHSKKVAQKHYWRVPDATFAEASKSGAKAVQNVHASKCSELQPVYIDPPNSGELCEIGGEDSVHEYTRQESNL